MSGLVRVSRQSSRGLTSGRSETQVCRGNGGWLRGATRTDALRVAAMYGESIRCAVAVILFAASAPAFALTPLPTSRDAVGR